MEKVFERNDKYIDLLIDWSVKQKSAGFITSTRYARMREDLLEFERVLTGPEIVQNTKLAFPNVKK